MDPRFDTFENLALTPTHKISDGDGGAAAATVPAAVYNAAASVLPVTTENAASGIAGAASPAASETAAAWAIAATADATANDVPAAIVEEATAESPTGSTTLGAPEILPSPDVDGGTAAGNDAAAAPAADTDVGATAAVALVLAHLGSLVPAAPGRRGGAPGYLVTLAGHAASSSFGEWVRRYLVAEIYGIRSEHTLEAKVRDLNGFMKWFKEVNGHAEIRHWLPRDTQAYLRKLEADGRSAPTVNRVFATLRRFARWAHDEPGSVFALGGLPTRGVKSRIEDEPTAKKLPRRDISRLLRVADMLVHVSESKGIRGRGRPRRDRLLLALLYYTGLRVSEMARLTLTQLQGSHLVNVVRKGAARSRRIFLPADCRRIIDAYLEHERPLDDPHGKMAPLVLSTAGESQNKEGFIERQLVNRVLNRLAAHAYASRPEMGPIKVSPHMLRHSFASEHRAKFGSDTETAAALGHTSLQYVGQYTRKTDAERDAMIEAMFE